MLQAINIRQLAGSVLAVVLATLIPGLAIAGQEVGKIPFFNAPPGTAALGGGVRLGQSLYRAVDNDDHRQTDLIPLYLYNGRYLFARGASGGVHFVYNENFELNWLARFQFRKLDPDRNAYYAGLEERRQTIDTGLEFRLKGDWGRLNASYLTDALDRHSGQTADVSYRYNFDRGRLTFSPFISWSWLDAEMTNYYYGVSAAEALPGRSEYTPGESQWFSYGLNTSYWLSDRVTLFGNVGFGGVDTVVANSPLVAEDSASAFLVGGTYVFGNARMPAEYISPERESEWSWRLNYGYQADGNIVGEIDQGEFKRSEFAPDSRIGGVTFGKLLSDGPRVDFVGRFSVFRHLEGDEGNGSFNSYAAYIMAFGKGYGRWSKEEWFRWGFGFGMSYADTVPIVEKRKQAAKSNNTSHFLNYLEMQLDFPLRRLFKSEAVKDCYAGLTVVHRSGIFGTSDLLGDVSGGSDWITAHFECTRF